MLEMKMIAYIGRLTTFEGATANVHNRENSISIVSQVLYLGAYWLIRLSGISSTHRAREGCMEMFVRLKMIFLSAVTLLAGCQSLIYGTASDFDRISLGMTKTQVIEVLGAPISTSADGDKSEESLVYKRMKHAISEWPRTYSVTLRNGKVVKYGEQYEERNINQY